MNVRLRSGILAGMAMTLLGGCSSGSGGVVEYQDGGIDTKAVLSDSSGPSRDGAAAGDAWVMVDIPTTVGDGPGVGEGPGAAVDGPPTVDHGDVPAAASDGPTGNMIDGSAIPDAPLGSPDVGGADGAFPAGCTLCHGSGANPAPPRDFHGNTATTFPGVGAHQQHLATSTWRAPIACGECHIVPTLPTYDTNVPTHMNGQDDVVWGPLARQGTFDAATNGCSGTYCHGSNLMEDTAGTTTIRAPIWTKVDGTQDACGMACHSTPPGGVHPASQSCESCHGQVIASFVPGPPPVVAWTDPTMHINGTVDVGTLACTSCHGTADRAATTLNPQLPAAPPVGTHGESATTDRAVGAHQRHLTDGTLASAIACAECHTVPTNTAHANGTVGMTFGTLAKTGNVTPSWTGTACSNVYCHGNFRNGTTTNAPVWTGTSQAVCGTCHGLPPGGTHPTSTTCGDCHTGYTASSVNLAAHINGTVDVSALTCTSCHGTAGRAATTLNPQLPAAPPVGTRGESATTDRAVGAHQRHLTDGTLANAIACTECHMVPTNTAHANGTVGMTFGTLAKTGDLSPAFNGTTCNNTYCHGGGLEDGTLTAPTWTSVDGSQVACGTCHGVPPRNGRHATHVITRGIDCVECHGTGYSGTSATKAVNVTLHIDGATNVGGSGSSITTWSVATGSCKPTCHNTRNW